MPPPVPPPRTKRDDSVAGTAAADSQSSPEGQARFRRACEVHLDFVWRFARVCGVEPAALEYVVHKVFAVLRGRLVSLEDPSELRVSVAGTTRHIVRAYLRQLSSPLETLARAEARSLDELDRIQGLETKTDGDLVDIILSTMSEAEREIFVLSELEGFSSIETAEALHVTEATLRVRLSDARKIFNDASARLRAQRFWVRRATNEP